MKEHHRHRSRKPVPVEFHTTTNPVALDVAREGMASLVEILAARVKADAFKDEHAFESDDDDDKTARPDDGDLPRHRQAGLGRSDEDAETECPAP